MKRSASKAPPEFNATRTYLIPSEWGRWRVTFTDLGLSGLHLPTQKKVTGEVLKNQEGPAGRKFLRAFENRLKGGKEMLPWDLFDLSGYPAFHIKIWKAMQDIPFGEVRSYGQVAALAGSPRACRAAGSACANCPITLFIPCHRVVSSNGLGGFGSSLSWKKRLLALEGYSC